MDLARPDPTDGADDVSSDGGLGSAADGESSKRVERTSSGGERPPNSFGDVVRRLREARRLTQTALAARMDQSVSYISLIESGRRKPTQRVMASLQSALDLSPAEASELQVAAGVPISPLDNAVNQCLAALEELVGMDIFDRHLARQDLTTALTAWRDILQGEREMEAGRFASAEEHFAHVANNQAATPIVRGNAHFRRADVQEKQGRLEESEAAIRDAENAVRLLDDTQALALRAEILGTHGFMASRAGKSVAAQALTERGRAACDKLLDAASQPEGLNIRDPEAAAVAQIGIANYFSRLALQALFAGEAQDGLSYAQQGLGTIPVAPERDVIRTRLRLQGLEAWANARLERFDEARTARLRIRREYEAIHDDYGKFKSLAYLADDYRSQAVAVLGESATQVDSPVARRARIAALEGESLDTFRSALDEAIVAYREAIAGLDKLGENILLASAWRNLGEALHYRWLLDGQDKDRDECALCLSRAKLIETQISERQGHSGRRLVLVYESLAKFAWDEGSLASARDGYVRIRQELDNNSQATSTDRAGQRLRERVTQALDLLSASGFPETSVAEATPDGATSAGTVAGSATYTDRRLREASAGQRMAWARINEQFDQVIIHDLRDLIQGGLKGMSDLSSRWGEALYELELQDGPRLMAQGELSSILFMKALHPISEGTSSGRQKRREHLETNIRTAKNEALGVCYHDICSARQVSISLRAPLGVPETRHFERGLALLREADEVYRLTPIPFELPFGFAIKDRLLLLEIPKALASDELGARLDEPGEFMCFRIERNWPLLEQMSGIFTQLLAIGQANELSGSRAADWLERMRASGLAAQQTL